VVEDIEDEVAVPSITVTVSLHFSTMSHI